LLQLAPNDPMSHYWRAWALKLRASELETRKQWAAALPDMLEVRDIFARLQRQDPENDLFALKLSKSYGSLSHGLFALDMPDESYQARCTALDLCLDVVTRFPRKVDAILDLCSARNEMAAWHTQRATLVDFRRALEYNAGTEQIIQQLAAAGFLTTRMNTADELINYVRSNNEFVRNKLRERGEAE